MIDLRDYNEYKQARMNGDTNTLDALETDDPYMFGIYERIFDYEEVQKYVKELDEQRKIEEQYKKWVNLHGFDINRHKMTDECFKASFTLSGTADFYERYKEELKEGKI